MFKILVLCVIFEISTAAVCPGSTVTQALQDTILSTHNNFRSQLAKGLSVIKGGALASGAKNMYELTYDCDLEATAQTLANKCLGANVAGHSPDSVLTATNTGENLYSSNAVQTTQALLIAGMNDWWGELEKYGGITPTDVKLTLTNFALGIGHWTQMAWGKTTTVGCAFKQCPSLNNQVMVVCHYRARGNYADTDIYERGTACAADTECTTYPNSKCNLSTKLCYTGDTTTTTTTTTKPTTTGLGWTAWAPSSCTSNCGLCGRTVMKRICRSATCPGASTLLTETACGSPAFCVFGQGLPSCCAPAKRAIVNGVLMCT